MRMPMWCKERPENAGVDLPSTARKEIETKQRAFHNYQIKAKGAELIFASPRVLTLRLGWNGPFSSSGLASTTGLVGAAAKESNDVSTIQQSGAPRPTEGFRNQKEAQMSYQRGPQREPLVAWKPVEQRRAGRPGLNIL